MKKWIGRENTTFVSPVMDLHHIRIDSLKKEYQPYRIGVDVLRLDELHPQISGNKWFKLQPYIRSALAKGHEALISFGGPYSNHILATAAACREAGLSCAGIIRGEEGNISSPTLADARALGMQLHHISRAGYREKKIPDALVQQFSNKGFTVVGEGGYGKEGAGGAATMLESVDLRTYTHILVAMGTGTTMAGLVMAAASFPQLQVIGIPVLKHEGIEGEMTSLLPSGIKTNYQILPGFEWGGYARQEPALIEFQNEWFRRTGIPSDFVYTGKLFFALDQLVRQDFFKAGSRLLAVHSGGLQGNRSLPKDLLMF